MDKHCIFKSSTAQADIRIEHHQDELHLKFNADQEAIQSAIRIDKPHRLVMKNLQYLMGILLFVPEPKNILLLGVGGGSLIHFFQHYLPECHISAVEYNADLLEIAFNHFQLPRAGKRLTYIIDDARRYVATDSALYDLIVVDIFENNHSPQWLQQDIFFSQVKNRLSSQGAVACNLLIDNEKAFVDFYKTFRKQFQQQALCLETEEYENILVYGLRNSPIKRSMTEQLELSWQLSQKYELPFAQILAVIYDINPVDSGII